MERETLIDIAEVLIFTMASVLTVTVIFLCVMVIKLAIDIIKHK